jgi:hypothetical protein
LTVTQPNLLDPRLEFDPSLQKILDPPLIQTVKDIFDDFIRK